MRTEDFQADLCRSCGKVIWVGICRTGFLTKADIERLTTVDQISALLGGRHLYRVIKTCVSFTLKHHGKMSMDYYKDPIVLASHICTTTHLFQSTAEAPTYFVSIPPVVSDQSPTPEGFPF